MGNTILLVDDDREFQNLMKAKAEDNCELLTTKCGRNISGYLAEIQGTIERKKIDILIINCNLFAADGRQIAFILRSIYPHLKIVLTSINRNDFSAIMAQTEKQNIYFVDKLNINLDELKRICQSP